MKAIHDSHPLVSLMFSKKETREKLELLSSELEKYAIDKDTTFLCYDDGWKEYNFIRSFILRLTTSDTVDADLCLFIETHQDLCEDLFEILSVSPLPCTRKLCRELLKLKSEWYAYFMRMRRIPGDRTFIIRDGCPNEGPSFCVPRNFFYKIQTMSESMACIISYQELCIQDPIFRENFIKKLKLLGDYNELTKQQKKIKLNNFLSEELKRNILNITEVN